MTYVAHVGQSSYDTRIDEILHSLTRASANDEPQALLQYATFEPHDGAGGLLADNVSVLFDIMFDRHFGQQGFDFELPTYLRQRLKNTVILRWRRLYYLRSTSTLNCMRESCSRSSSNEPMPKKPKIATPPKTSRKGTTEVPMTTCDYCDDGTNEFDRITVSEFTIDEPMQNAFPRLPFTAPGELLFECPVCQESQPVQKLEAMSWQ